MKVKTYGKYAIVTLLKQSDEELGSRLDMREDGIWTVPLTKLESDLYTKGELRFLDAHPTCNHDTAALPFPFTGEQFIAFCDTFPLFTSTVVDWLYTSSDDSIEKRSVNEHAIADLDRISPPAAELVRLLLIGSPSDGRQLAESEPTARGGEKALARNFRLVREILLGLGHEDEMVPNNRGGRKKGTLKQKALEVALTEKYTSQGMTESNFKRAWDDLPKSKSLPDTKTTGTSDAEPPTRLRK